MEINATSFGLILFIFVLSWVVIATSLAYAMAKKRFNSPAPVIIMNFIFSFMPPLSFISLLVLSMKSELESQ